MKTPINNRTIQNLKIGDKIEINGIILTGRDAALPKLVKSIIRGQNLIDIEGSVMMHTAVSDAGISPTTSNKEEIEESIPFLAKSGVKNTLRKGFTWREHSRKIKQIQFNICCYSPRSCTSNKQSCFKEGSSL